MSLLLLLFIAMPVKYVWGNPGLVQLIGAVHGGLFLAYIVAAVWIAKSEFWSGRQLFICTVLSCLPFGTFYFEKRYLGR